MADHSIHPTPYFGLRDFLFYLIPGLTTFLSFLLIFTNITLDEFNKYGTIASSILALLISYILGHFIYPLNYILRPVIRSFFSIWDKKLKELDKTLEDSEKFNQDYHYTVTFHNVFFFSEISRNRSLARFSSAMVIPTILLGLAFGYRTPIGIDWKDISFGFIGLLGSLGFAFRYKHYYKRYRQYIQTCRTVGITTKTNTSEIV